MELDNLIKSYKPFLKPDQCYSITIEMANGKWATKRVRTAMQKFEKISNDLFKGKSIWILLNIWSTDHGTYNDLEKTGFTARIADDIIHKPDIMPWYDLDIKKDDDVLALHLKKYQYKSIESLVRAIAGWELGLDLSANITAYFISEGNSSTLLNFYDDRGMEVLTTDNEVYDYVLETYPSYVLRSRSANPTVFLNKDVR